MMPRAISVRGLHFEYPDGRHALQGIDLDVERHERTAILGPNGAGKTTLALQLNGVLRPSAGTVIVEGLELTKDTLKEVRRRVGIVFQDPDDQLFMPTVYEDVAFGPANLGLSGESLRSRAMESLESVGMARYHDRPPHHLSFGQKRRVCIASVLAMEPEILVLDEPTSNLDPAGRRELFGILTALDQTMVVISHDLPYVLELCPRSVVMNEGRIVADGSTKRLLADDDLLRRNRLELPYGFNPALVDAP